MRPGLFYFWQLPVILDISFLVDAAVQSLPGSHMVLFLCVYLLSVHVSVFRFSSYKDTFPGGSDDKESACNAGDLGSIPGSGRSLEKGMASHSSILAWKVPWTEEPGRPQSMGL